jgi:hypothetical protein
MTGDETSTLKNSVPPRPAQELRTSEPHSWHWAQNLVGIGAVLALCYYGEEVLVILLISVLLAFILAPVVDLLTRLWLPRALAAALAMLLLLTVLGGTVYYSYNQAADLLQDLPKYSKRVRDEITRVRNRAETLDGFTDPRLRVGNPGVDCGLLRPLSGVFHVDLAEPRALGDSYAFSAAQPADGVCNPGADFSDDPDVYGGECADRIIHRCGGYGDFLGTAPAFFLLCGIHQRILKPGALSGSGAGAGAPDLCRSGPPWSR